MRKYQIIFLILGILMFLNTVLFNISYIEAGKFPEGIIFVGITIMSFCLAYVSEHLIGKDERAKKIRERSIYISYFWILIFSVILLALVNPYINIIELSSYHLLLVFITFYISIVFLSMVFYAKKF